MEKLLDTREAAELLGLSAQTLRAWRIRGEGPRFRKLGVGAKCPVRYALTDLDAWVDAGARGSTSDDGSGAGCSCACDRR